MSAAPGEEFRGFAVTFYPVEMSTRKPGREGEVMDADLRLRRVVEQQPSRAEGKADISPVMALTSSRLLEFSQGCRDHFVISGAL